jgi:hypothetical protein
MYLLAESYGMNSFPFASIAAGRKTEGVATRITARILLHDEAE